jgi:uncharacterized protein
VFTHDFSDWSTLEDLSQTSAIWWRVMRKKDSLEVQCSKDGAQFMTIRQGYFPAASVVQVGVMCAAPEGAGFDATFDQFTLEHSVPPARDDRQDGFRFLPAPEGRALLG